MEDMHVYAEKILKMNAEEIIQEKKTLDDALYAVCKNENRIVR